MTKTITVQIKPENLSMPCYCSFNGGTSFWGNTQWVDSGCEEDLTEKVLEAWDGTSKPFIVKCDWCRHEYEFALSIEVEVDKTHKGRKEGKHED